VLVRDGALHRETFAYQADYLSALPGGLTARGAHNFSEYGPQLSRVDRAVKVWTTMMSYGVERFGEVFAASVAQAAYLGRRIAQASSLELMAPVTLNVVCVRFRGHLPEGTALDDLNAELLVALQESGFCVVSPYRHRGQFCLRAALSNHRTRQSDLDAFVTELERAGRAAVPGHGDEE
jgi:glutamate/tyrosine decarboxylase-like PLP-dependent enzyme